MADDATSDGGPTPIAVSPPPIPSPAAPPPPSTQPTTTTTITTTTPTRRRPDRSDRSKSRRYRSTSPMKPYLPHSSDSLLHHLHTDPTSSHISLCNPSALVGLGDDVVAAAAAAAGGSQSIDPTSSSHPIQHTGTRQAMELIPPTETQTVAKGLMGKPLMVIPPSPEDDGRTYGCGSSDGKKRIRPKTAPTKDMTREWISVDKSVDKAMDRSVDKSVDKSADGMATGRSLPISTLSSRLSRQAGPYTPTSPTNNLFATSGGSPRNTHHVRLTSQSSTPQLKETSSDDTSSTSDSQLDERERRECGISTDEEDEEEGDDENIQHWPAISLDGTESHSPFPQHTDDTPDEYPFHTMDKSTLVAGSSKHGGREDVFPFNMSQSSTATTTTPADHISPSRNPSPRMPARAESGDNCVAEFVLLTDMMDAARRRGSLGEISTSSKSSGKKSHTTVIGVAGRVNGVDDHDGTGADMLDGDDFSPTGQSQSSNHLHHSQLSDWNTFIRLYSSGAWDPNKAPYPPEVLQDLVLPGVTPSRKSSAPGTSPTENMTRSRTLGGAVGGAVGGFGMANQSRTVGASGDYQTRPLAIPENGNAGALTVAKSRALAASASVPEHNPPSLPAVVKGTTTTTTKTQSAEAAHLTLAAASLFAGNLSPFSVPSPDKELTDPMSNTGHSRTVNKKASSISEHGTSSSKIRSTFGGLSGSWSAPVDPELWHGSSQGTLATIAASPIGSPAEAPSVGHRESHPPVALVGSHRMPPLSAPAEWLNGSPITGPPDDYFGAAVAEVVQRRPSRNSRVGSDAPSTDTITPSYMPQRSPPVAKKITTPDSPLPDATKPRLTSHSSSGSADARSRVARRRSLFESHEAPAILGEVESSILPMTAPYATDESAYRQLGYLPAPIPPNEIARRKALYRYDLLNTGHDINFDRIAHLAKLVFRTKMVMITLLDEVKQFHKVDGGIGADTANRVTSLCAHSVLSKNGEPMIVLDTQSDWRFAGNPNVTGPPYIRFYAGAPLRTHDGFNLGSLCLIDPSPRKEFPPRSRMALKEFAAIVIREMELWREKSRLRARDRIQTSMERFTRECLELDNSSTPASTAAARMEKVYERASRLIRRTLNVDGAFILDLSQFETVETIGVNGEKVLQYQAEAYEIAVAPSELPATAEDFLHAPSYDPHSGERMHSFGTIPPWTMLGASEQLDPPPTRNQPISPTDHMKFSDFLQKNEDGRIYEHVVPTWIKHFIPSDIQYALLVPVFNIDHQPFALICAYTCDDKKLFLEGHELQFLRAIGVVLLSAVLKRRMVLADKAKSNFISNISHELRTPLHGILAAAELLGDTPLDSNQQAFLRTVSGCGNSLIETVNHVLDFTKLSGTTKGNLEAVIRPGSVNLAQLIEDTVEGCWIGQRARTFQGQSEIGSFYSPPTPLTIVGSPMERLHLAERMSHVETVVDIGMREKGWQVRCERGGIRRVLMNLIGNSLKFTKDGYIQITLRELPHSPGDKTIPIEMAVIDTGKGISRNFLKEQLFHPFSQENPLQTGTGLGLAIVNSIVRSDSVNGKVDVWSAEGLGTEIKITLNVDLEDAPSGSSDASSVSSRGSSFGNWRTVSMHCFNSANRGAKLNREVIASYLRWWNFEILEDGDQYGDVLVIDEDTDIITQLLKDNDVERAVLVLATNRISKPREAMRAYERAGGFAQMVFKPVGPGRLEAGLRASVAYLDRSTPSQSSAKLSRSDYFSPRQPPSHPARSPSSSDGTWPPPSGDARRPSGFSPMPSDSAGRGRTSDLSALAELESPAFDTPPYSRMPSARFNSVPGTLLRRRSDDDKAVHRVSSRPSMGPRSTTDYPVVAAPTRAGRPSPHQRTSSTSMDLSTPSTPGSPTSTMSAVSLDNGGMMLKTSTVPPDAPRRGRAARVMVVDDNAVNSNLLRAYCKKKGCDFAMAENGEIAVQVFENQTPGYWDLILMDISMPVMDGFEATRAIRKIESDRRYADAEDPLSSRQVINSRVKVMALTGLGSSDDKKKAFSAGVDGYLVKPVSFKSIDLILKNLGF